MIEPVPLYIGVPDAEHSADVLRMLVYSAFGGQEGVLGRFDLRVTEGDTPGSFVNLAPGACSVLARGPAQQYQMYSDLSRTQTRVPVSPTDSSGGRTDLVILRVEDPSDGSGLWSAPESASSGPYISPRVVEGVPGGSKSVHELDIGQWSALNLARLDIPASTGTVTQDMVTDLRVVSNPTTGLGPAPNGPGAEKMWTEATLGHTSGDQLTEKNTGWIDWPRQISYTVNVPEWATGADVFCAFDVGVFNAEAYGQSRIKLGSTYMSPRKFDINAISKTDPARAVIMMATTMAIEPDDRGKAVSVKSQGKFVPGSKTSGCVVEFDDNTSAYMSINFKQHPAYV